MRIGPLRHRLTIEKFEIVKNEIGEQKKVWNSIATVWGSIEVLNGKEYLSLLGTKEEVTSKITIRYIKNIDSKMRISFKERIFEIENILNYEERNIMLVLLCREIAGSK